MEKQKLNVNEIYMINGVNYRLNEDLELIELTKSIYDLKKGDDYWCIRYEYILRYHWIGNKNDREYLKMGNVFLTEEDARFELERRKTIAKIKRWKYENDDYKFIYGKENFYICFDYYRKRFEIGVTSFSHTLPSHLYFSSIEKTRACLEFIGEENWKKYVLEIKE